MAIVVVFLGAFGASSLMCGIGLWKLKPYGRTIQLVYSWIGLIGFPIGTIISILILIYLYKPGIKILFSGTPATQLTSEERVQVAAVTQGSMSGALIAVLLLVVAVPVIGIIAAIAIPGLLRARMSGNEASAIGSLRAINRAQERYSGLEELRNADFLQPDLSGAPIVTKNGYNISLERGVGAFLTESPTGCAGAVSNYFAHADPVTPGGTGTRFFASDARVTIVFGLRSIAKPIPETATVLR